MGGVELFRGVVAAPNHAVEPTANSLRSYVASAIGGGSPLALSRQDKLGVSCKVKVLVG